MEQKNNVVVVSLFTIGVAIAIIGCGGSSTKEPTQTKLSDERPTSPSINKDRMQKTNLGDADSLSADMCASGQKVYQLPGKDDPCTINFKSVPKGRYVLSELRVEIQEPAQKLKLFSALPIQFQSTKRTKENVVSDSAVLNPGKNERVIVGFGSEVPASLLNENKKGSTVQTTAIKSPEFDPIFDFNNEQEKHGKYVVKKDFGTVTQFYELTYNSFAVVPVFLTKGDSSFRESDLREYRTFFRTPENTRGDSVEFFSVARNTPTILSSAANSKVIGRGVYESETFHPKHGGRVIERLSAAKSATPDSFWLYYQYVEPNGSSDGNEFIILSSFLYKLEK